MTPEVLSIGYEGLSISEFVEALIVGRTGVLIDVREIPISRKKGFSKTSLRTHVEKAGVGYLHLRSLGSPKSMRHAVRRDGDYATFFDGVRQHLAAEQGQESLSTLADLSRHETICLMCFCRCWERCHRRIVLDALLAKRRVRIRHLVVGENDKLLFGAA